jgi:phospholipid/cholesterol/gamma-HCH transport system substrate-binding protein
MPREREIKVGLLILAAIAVLAGGIFLIGTEEKLFVRKSRYFIRFDDVGGLAPGGVVELNGVNVGKVEKVVLPDNPGRAEVVVWVEIERRYGKRLRAPAKQAAGSAPPAAPAPPPPAANPAPAPQATTAELKTQGLLGDKYVALTLGSAQYAPIPEGGEIPAAVPINVDTLLASGGDLMGQVKEIVKDLKNFTGTLNKNGGLVPRLVTDQDYGREVSAKLRSAVDNLSKVTGKIASGQGTLGKLVEDPSVYNGLSNVVSGVNQSPLLRRLIQNREKAGAKNAQQKGGAGGAGAAAQQPPPKPPPKPPQR